MISKERGEMLLAVHCGGYNAIVLANAELAVG